MITHPTKKFPIGFSLIELLVVVAILATLMTVVLTAINPTRQLAQTHNTKRRADIEAILNAVHQYMTDNGGEVPSGIDTAAKTIASTISTNTIDLCSILVTRYLSDLPIDPVTGTKSYSSGKCTQAGAVYDTKYTIIRSATDKRVTVTALSAELNEVISVTR